MGVEGLSHDDLLGTPGRRWRLLATAVRGQCARVEPVLLAHDHPFARLIGPQNAVTAIGERSGAITLLGAGAGGDATACSIIADLLSAGEGSPRRATNRP